MLAALGAGRAGALSGAAGDAFMDTVAQIDQLSAALRGQGIGVADWRSGLDAAFAAIDSGDILAAIDFDRLVREAGHAERGVSTAPVRLVAEDGARYAFFPKFFAVSAGRAIIPHGHANMVSAHLTLSGRFHLRQYDRVAIEDDALVIRPTVDRETAPGDLSSIGDPEDNVHWFVALEDAYTFDTIVTNLDAANASGFDIFNIDPLEASPLGQDLWRAPRLSVADGLAKYG